MLATLGLDIGGANLKAAHSAGTACTRPFALWKHPDRLTDALRNLLADMPAHQVLAVTMTGELCDCYESKQQGVNAILQSVSQASDRPIRVWTTAGRFVSPAEAQRAFLQTAAANWLALAHFAGRHVPQGTALLIDMGSTTTDLVLLQDGRPRVIGLTDPERLRSGELLYTGVRRTPLCALLGPGHAAELFATTLDANLLLGLVPENPDDCDTADGRPATRQKAHARLARMLCGDGDMIDRTTTWALASKVLDTQESWLRNAVAKVLGGIEPSAATLLLAGSGEFLLRRALGVLPWARVISLAQILGPQLSEAACAYALALSAAEQA